MLIIDSLHSSVNKLNIKQVSEDEGKWNQMKLIFFLNILFFELIIIQLKDH